MGLFKKLFGKKKNEIHLSAEEAFAEAKPVPFTAQPETAPDENDTQKRGEPLDTTVALDSGDQEKLRRVLYQSYDKIEEAPIALRSALRACVKAASESADRFEVTLADQSLAAVKRESVSARAKLPEALLGSLDSAPASIRERVLGFNQRLDIAPLRKGSRFEESYSAFLDALTQQLMSYELIDDTRLVRSDGKLLWDTEGNTELGEAPQPVETDTKQDGTAPAEKPEIAGDASAHTAATVDAKPKSRAERSMEAMLAHGIEPDRTYNVEIDEGRIFPRSIKETVERISALTATALIAQAYQSRSSASPASWSAALVNRYETLYGVKRSFTPKESAYLRDPGTGKHSLFALKAEAAAILMWALGYIELSWPDKSADLTEIGDILKINDINLICSRAKARDKEELLDMYDLTARLHALCVRSGFKELKETGLDPDIIYERHYALNWLLGIGGFTAWDSIIPTT